MEATTAKRAGLAQRIPPGRAAAASPGQGADPARHARGWRGGEGGRRAGGAPAAALSVGNSR